MSERITYPALDPPADLLQGGAQRGESGFDTRSNSVCAGLRVLSVYAWLAEYHTYPVCQGEQPPASASWRSARGTAARHLGLQPKGTCFHKAPALLWATATAPPSLGSHQRQPARCATPDPRHCIARTTRRSCAASVTETSTSNTLFSHATRSCPRANECTGRVSVSL